MITHEEAINLAKLFGRAVVIEDRPASAMAHRLINHYLTQPDHIDINALLRIACEAVDRAKCVTWTEGKP